MRFSTSTLGANYHFQPKSVVDPNHLGNVLTVVSDRKIGVTSEAIVQLDFNSCTGACGYESEITPPGTVLNVENVAGDHKLHVTTSYRYDGAHLNFPTIQGHTYVITYEVSAGSTPNMGIYAVLYERLPANTGIMAKWPIYGTNSMQFTAVGYAYDLKIMKAYSDGTFEDFYIDNVVIEDLNGSNANYISHFTPEIISSTDYYAFGAPMNGRQFNSNSYKYGFNGKENDNETGTQDYGLRIYNPALGKFLSVDPIAKEYPWNSTYAFAEDSPIENIDLDGAEKYNFRLTENDGETKLELLGIDVTESILGVEFVPRESFIVEFEGNHYSFPEYIDAPSNTNDKQFADFVSNEPRARIKNSDEEHNEMVATAAAGAFVGMDPVGALRNKLSLNPSQKSQANANGGVKSDGHKKVDYTGIDPKKGAKASANFTQVQKEAILEKNKQANGGVIKSDLSGKVLNQPKQDKRGIKTDMNSAQIDHSRSKKNGGSNAGYNARVLSKEENTKKGSNNGG